MTLQLLCYLLSGSVLGAGMCLLSQRMIRSRTGSFPHGVLLGGWIAPVLWGAVGALGCGAIQLLIPGQVTRLQYAGVFLVLLGISAVDGNIHKIPNELLLVLLVFKLVFVAVSADYASLLPALAGMICGFVLFLIPSRMGVNIGIGDVKLAGVIGFYLGVTGLLQTVLIMGVVLGAYALYLLSTHRGTLKSRVAMGPALSLGMLISLMYPLTLSVVF